MSKSDRDTVPQTPKGTKGLATPRPERFERPSKFSEPYLRPDGAAKFGYDYTRVVEIACSYESATLYIPRGGATASPKFLGPSACTHKV